MTVQRKNGVRYSCFEMRMSVAFERSFIKNSPTREFL
jgi:hypothetical protein